MDIAETQAAYVEQKRRELAEAERLVEKRRVQLATAEEMMRLLALPANAIKPPRARNFGGLDGRKGPKGAWRAILQEIIKALSPDGVFGFEAIELAARRAGREVNRNSIRSQMANYATSGLVERVADGKFRLLPAAAHAVGLPGLPETARPDDTKAASLFAEDAA